MAYQIQPIEPAVLDQLRTRDDAGQPPRIRTDQAGGSPLRCCLRRSHPSERIALVSYAPLRRWARETGASPGPYDEVGPVFIHPEPCPGPPDVRYPAAFTGTRRVFRAYAADGTILGGRLAEDSELVDRGSAERLLGEMLDDPQVALIHARAVEFGCFTFEVRRVAAPAS